jgi:hypothetical protein
LSPELELKNFRDLLKLQLYLGAVSPVQAKKSKHLLLSLPVLFASPNEIEKEYPELVETKFDVELQEVSLSALTERVALKEAYHWQLSLEHWDELKNKFPSLSAQKSDSVEERYEVLAQIPIKERAEIDLFTKKMIVQDHTEWLEEALIKAPKKRELFGLRSRGGDLPFKGAIDRMELRESLEKTPIGSSFSYTADGEHHYRIAPLASPGALEIVTFGVARNDGTLDLLLDRHLSQIYPEVRKKHPALFAQKEGGFKPFKEVQDLVGAEAFAEILHCIEEESKQYGVVWTDQMKHSLDLFAKYRFITYMQQVRDALSNGVVEEEWVRSSPSSQEGSSAQWKLIKEQKTLKREEAALQHLEKLFDEKENMWSQTQADGASGPYFYHIRQKLQQAPDIDAMVTKRRELLSLDAQRVLFVELLEKMSSKGLMMNSTAFQKGLQEGA